MSQQHPLPTRKQRRASGKRSTTGCRTCRARHVKCDESPGLCKNCTLTGRKCDGYDLHRLKVQSKMLPCPQKFGTHFGWITTAEERHFFSYFQHHSIPSLVGLSDSPLWQQLVLQMSHAEQAAYHAVIMLGAIHQVSEENGMRLTGADLYSMRHRFALDQSSRSFSSLNKRSISHDPQLYQVLLLCCLLYIISEILWGHYESAIRHLQNGLRVLKEFKANQSLETPIEQFLVVEFTRLDAQACHFGGGKPQLHIDIGLDDELLDSSCAVAFSTITEVQDVLSHLLNAGIPFLARCWKLSPQEIIQEYESLSFNQLKLLSRYHAFMHQFEIFCKHSYIDLNEREKRKADLVRIQCLSQTLPLKICLLRSAVPEAFIPEYITLVSAVEALMNKLSARPTMTLDGGVIPGLFIVASSCPDYRVRLRAIRSLLVWPHCEGWANSNLAAYLTLESLKAEMARQDKKNMQKVAEVVDDKGDNYLLDTLRSVETIADWSPISKSAYRNTNIKPLGQH
ncbi:hypothetical protein BDV23DRAFT_173030 [Aspergillus alliaceus]|uniref:Zn(2)-C6 fungal-type domain-containing protein n=1 Tax=Petromyces alliaceus TaxID=209559 RepID=A0A5N7C6R1_PETAA|nr:hypothetical protein BDV23DRAFT_173030 [Aspergillus alliaceus]